mmetsp:Transcript_34810/g.92956  ORF Transcript_34810/g.92956 Transcript_34810/m.92956 type:complete len:174 (+) Transcript_34810:270-791(+)
MVRRGEQLAYRPATARQSSSIASPPVPSKARISSTEHSIVQLVAGNNNSWQSCASGRARVMGWQALITQSHVALTIHIASEAYRTAVLLQNAGVAVSSSDSNHSTKSRRHATLASAIVSETHDFSVGLKNACVSATGCHCSDGFEVRRHFTLTFTVTPKTPYPAARLHQTCVP